MKGSFQSVFKRLTCGVQTDDCGMGLHFPVEKDYDSEPESEPIIPGLPDSIAMICLSLLPRRHIYTCRSVSKSWKKFLESDDLLGRRKQREDVEEWLYVLGSNLSDDTSSKVYDPSTNQWGAFPPIPSQPPYKGFVEHFRCVAVDSRLFLIGGVYKNNHGASVCSRKVFVFNALSRSWSCMSSMKYPRANFACAASKGKIYVAGGDSMLDRFNGGQVQSAEVFDVEKNEWRMLPDMRNAKFACNGFVTDSDDGELFVVVGDFSEVLNLDTEHWTEMKSIWNQYGFFKKGLMAEIGRQLYKLQANVISAYDFSEKQWTVALLGDEDKFSSQSLFFPFRDELYTVPLESGLPIGVFNPQTMKDSFFQEEKFRSKFSRFSIVVSQIM